MDSAIAGLLGAGIGAVTGLLGGLISGWQQRKGDVVRWSQARRDELRKEERRSLLELTNVLAEGSQAAVWLTWEASVNSADMIRGEVREYNARMRTLLPRLFSAEAAASGLSDEAFSMMDPLVQRLLTLDTNVSKAAAKLETEPDEAMPELASYNEMAFQLTRDIVLTVRFQLRFDSAQSPPLLNPREAQGTADDINGGSWRSRSDAQRP